MKKKVYFCFLLFVSVPLFAQIENPNSTVRLEAIEDDFESPDGIEFHAIKTPSLTDPKDPFTPNNYADLGLEKSKELDITKGDGLLTYRTDEAPKYFAKDKEESKGIYFKDQYLGDFKTSSKTVTIMYRDHEYVDGDRIRVFVNEDIIQSNVYLNGSFSGFTFNLASGFNRIDFQALNQGTSGPNTAELQVFDDDGVLLSANRWNLSTGSKATVIIVKE